MDAAHRLDRVHDQVEKHLLQLDSIPRHARQRPVELGPKNDVVAAHLALCERDDLENLAVDIEQLHARYLALRERADARDDLARSLAVCGDVVERRARFRNVGRFGGKPACAGSRARHHRPQGLADLVDDRSGQLAQSREPRHMSKLRPGDVQRIVLFLQPFLGALALRDVLADAPVADEAPSFIEHRHSRNGEIVLAAVRRRTRQLEVAEGQVRVQHRAVVAPRVFVRLEIWNLPARLADVGVECRCLDEPLRDFPAREAVLGVGLRVHVEREPHDSAEALLARTQCVLGAPPSRAEFAEQQAETEEDREGQHMIRRCGERIHGRDEAE